MEIDYKEMYKDLEGKFDKVMEDIFKTDLRVNLTLEERPPKIYVIYRTHSPLEVEKESDAINKIMRSHGLMGFPVRDHNFESREHRVNAYGLNPFLYQVIDLIDGNIILTDDRNTK